MKINKLLGEDILDHDQLMELLPFLEMNYPSAIGFTSAEGDFFHVIKSSENLCSNRSARHPFKEFPYHNLADQLSTMDIKKILTAYIVYHEGYLDRALSNEKLLLKKLSILFSHYQPRSYKYPVTIWTPAFGKGLVPNKEQEELIARLTDLYRSNVRLLYKIYLGIKNENK